MLIGSGTNPIPNYDAGKFWYQSFKLRYTDGSAIVTIASEDYVTTNAALKSGATFSGKVNTTASATAAPLNIAVSTTAPTAAIAGDIWIGTNNVFFKDSTGTTRALPNSNTTNTFSSSQIIDTTSATPGIRITQKGTGAALLVEDSINPDASAFSVDTAGNVGIGIDPSTWSATQKLDVNGVTKTTAIIFSGTAQFKVNSLQANPTNGNFDAGKYPSEILMSYNGSTYAVPARLISTP